MAIFDDWTDLTPDALTIPANDTDKFAWVPTVSGPQSDKDIANSAFTTWGKEYLTVGPTKNAGKFTDIQKALNACKQAGSGAIYILNGTYQLPDTLWIPDVPLKMIGQSRDGVIIKNVDGDDAFNLNALTKIFTFTDFTIQSQNTGGGGNSYMFDIYGATTGTFNFKSISLILSSQADRGIYGHVTGTPSISITDDCYFEAGAYAAYLDGFSKASVNGNRCEAQTTIAMYIYSLVRKSTICSENIVTNFEKQGISVTSFEAMVLDNICDYFTDTPTGLIVGINAYASGCILRGNKVTIDNSEAQTEIVYGINVTYPQATMGKSQIIQNSVFIDIDSENAVVRGTNVKNQSDCNVSLNEIVLINADANNDSHGMYFENADRSKIVGNGIYMQNLATDIGINLDGNTDNCQGGDNITYLVGTSVADAGAGNVVTAQDV